MDTLERFVAAYELSQQSRDAVELGSAHGVLNDLSPAVLAFLAEDYLRRNTVRLKTRPGMPNPPT